MEKRYVIGVDVSKKTLDLEMLDSEGRVVKYARIENMEKSVVNFFNELPLQLSDFQPEKAVVCLEHTGIYANLLLDYLSQHRIATCIEMALQIKKSQGLQRGKSDRADAHRIAHYALTHLKTLRWWTPARLQVKKLKALLTLRNRLLRVYHQLRVPLLEAEDFVDSSIIKNLNRSSCRSLRAVKKDIDQIDQTIRQLIRDDNQMEKQYNVVTSVTGVGPVIAAHMIVSTNEFKDITDPKKFACYAGVAPFAHTSGTSIKGKPKVSKLANMNIKKLLYLGAHSAVQHNLELKAYYQRKLDQGKKPMSVLNAVGNKLISRIFACIRDGRKFEKEYKVALA